jgi:hypothetical protein
VASRGDWPSRHDHAPSATTDRYPATPTPPYGPCNRRQGPFVAGGLWPRRSVAALVTVDLAWGGAEHQISLRLRFEVMAPFGGVERPGRVVRFARLIHRRRGRVLGGPAVRAACGGSQTLPWWPLSVACVLTAPFARPTLDVSRLDAIVVR